MNKKTTMPVLNEQVPPILRPNFCKKLPILSMRTLCCAIFGFLMMNSWALAQTNGLSSKTLEAANLASSCSNCHGPWGHAVPKSSIPSLKGLDAEHIRTSLLQFKTGRQNSTIMNQIAKGYTDEQINLIASYLGEKH